MKKFLIVTGIVGIFGGFLYLTSASTGCKEVKFANDVTTCINIEKAGTNKRNLITDIEGGTKTNLKCDLMTPDSNLISITECNGQFTYKKTKPGKLKIRMRYNNAAPIDWENKPDTTSEWTYPQWTYHFGNQEWIDDISPSSTTSSYTITASPSSPNENEWVDITIKADSSSYRGTIKFKVERKSGSSWITASSSLYSLSLSSYKFTSSDKGKKTFTDLVKFKDNSYIYRLVVYDSSDSSIKAYKTFSLNGTEEENDTTDNFLVTTNNTTPKRNQLVNLTIKARQGTSTNTEYRGIIKFEVRYRESGYNNRTKTTSLSYYEMKYPYEDEGYRFTSSNNGQVTITDFIRFKREGYEYKIVVKDKDNATIKGEKIFKVGTDETTNGTDNFYITTDDATPKTNQRVDLTVKARQGTSTNTEYRGTIQFEIYYRHSGSSTWTKTTSSTYFEMAGSYKDNGYTFTSSNNGQKTFSNFIRFKKNNYSYKVLVYDENDEDIKGYKIFTVGSISSNNSNINGFSTSQLNTVQAIYDARNDMINNLKNSYPKLKTNTRRQNMSDDLYTEMKKIINNDSSRKYDDFTEFYNAFLDRYRYTVSIR